MHSNPQPASPYLVYMMFCRTERYSMIDQCYNTPCNIAASDHFRPLEHSRSWLIPFTGTSPCRQPSHHGTALSPHPYPCSPVLLGMSRPHISGSPWINSVHSSLVISGHLCCPLLDCLRSAWLSHPGPLLITSCHLSQTSSAY
jgi:hypothetical protein